MYKRNAQGWSKHFDFILIDEISLQIAFVIATYARLRIWAYSTTIYRSLGLILVMVDALVLVLHNSMHNVIDRDYYSEIKETLKHCFLVLAISAIYLFATQTGDVYSRIILFLTFLLHLILGYGLRVAWKSYVQNHRREKINKPAMLVVADPDNAEKILMRLDSDSKAEYKIVGLVLTEDTDQTEVSGHKIVATIEDAADYICREWIDAVYIDASLTNEKVNKLMDDCAQMAVTTHYHVPYMSRNGSKLFSERIGGTTVLTSSINYATPLQVIMKRCFDIVIGLIGSVAALLIMAVAAPIIKKQSPGPVLFKQERIGKNGKRFTIYKIRSMYMDAEERKKDLMEKNRVKDGMMFKLDFDPRIIGNEILPDGTRKTGIGEFLRRTSLDEFPQFFNVLEGSMSTIGTRPPTPDEYNKYQYHHRARLAIKPGITGMWQISGRSEITDFEEVVRLDTEYITNWSPALDIKIFFKTIGVLFSGKGAM